MSLNGSPKWMYNAGGDFYPYKINQSLRHNEPDRVSLDKSFASGTDASGTTWSFSAWVKRGDLTRRNMLVMWSNSSNIQEDIRFHEDDKLRWYCHNSSGSAADSDLKTARVFRDNSAWYHILCVKDTTQSTASNRNKIYINGVQETNFTTANYSSQNYANYAGLNHNVSVGGPSTGGTSHHFDGYIAEVQFINGTALGPEYFGETKEGIWIPKKSYADQGGSYGTNGFYLKYVAGSEGTDSSGNGNNFTLVTGNASRGRAVQDSPTNNFCVIPYSNNPTLLAKEHQGMRLNTTRTGYWDGAYGSFSVKSGKWYYEAQMNETAGDAFRVIPGWKQAPDADIKVFNRLGTSADPFGTSNTGDFGNLGHYAFPPWNATFFGNGGYTGTKSAASKGDVLNVAVDLDNNKIYFGLNGTYLANDGGTDGDPANGTNESLSGLLNNGKFYSPSVCLRNDNNVGSNSVRFNFGSDRSFGANLSLGTAYADENGFGEFRYSVPSGFLALCSENLPNPEVDPNDGENPTDYFKTVLYTGDGQTTKNVTVGFEPDFTWIKGRSAGHHHSLIDSVRGDIALNANQAIAEYGVSPFNSNPNGTIDVPYYNNAYSMNTNSTTYVAWNWLGGGAASNNSNGTIQSSVSANTDAGFSIVSYTGNGGSSATVGHGLTQAPNCIWLKRRTAGEGWVSFWNTPAMGPTKFLGFNSTGAAATSSGEWNNTAPTNTVFTIGNQGRVNTGSATYIAYCFHNVEGYCKVGQYRGNSNADGTTINCGFRPAWILIKSTASGADWAIYDSTRLGYNVDNNIMRIGSASSIPTEQTDDDIDIYSTGFKFRRSSPNFNNSSADFVYIAFAEQPFRYATAR